MDTDFQKHRKMIASMLSTLDGVQEAKQQTRELQQTKIILEKDVKALKTERDDLARPNQVAKANLEKQIVELRGELTTLRNELTAAKAEKTGTLRALEDKIAEVRAELDNLSKVRDNLKAQLQTAASTKGDDHD